MASTRKPQPHKEIFLKVADTIAEISKPYGFIDHPVYATGWDRYNQEYSRYLIRKDTSKFIDEIEFSYMPARRHFFFYLTRRKSDPELVSLLAENCAVVDWANAANRIYDRYDLRPHSRWYISLTPACCLSKRDLNDPDAAATKMVKRYQKYADYLFKAVDEKEESWNVSVDYYGDTNTGKRLSPHHRVGRY